MRGKLCWGFTDTILNFGILWVIYLCFCSSRWGPLWMIGKVELITILEDPFIILIFQIRNSWSLLWTYLMFPFIPWSLLNKIWNARICAHKLLNRLNFLLYFIYAGFELTILTFELLMFLAEFLYLCVRVKKLYLHIIDRVGFFWDTF